MEPTGLLDFRDRHVGECAENLRGERDLLVALAAAGRHHRLEPLDDLHEGRSLGNVGCKHRCQTPLDFGLLGAPALFDEGPHERELLPKFFRRFRSPAIVIVANCVPVATPELVLGKVPAYALEQGDGVRVHVYRSVVARSIENLGRLRKRKEREVGVSLCSRRKSCSQNTTT